MGVLDWMADELRAAGLTVIEYPAWRDRHAPGSFAPRAVMWHHDASALGPSPAMDTLIAVEGNTTTPPPLAQAWVDTGGVWTLCASGRANHAGTGGGWGRIGADQGNRDAIGIETDHTTGETWPGVQLDSLRHGTAVLLHRLGANAGDALCGHREYTTRKTDPAGLDMNWERGYVASLDVGAHVITDQDIARFWAHPIKFHNLPANPGGPAWMHLEQANLAAQQANQAIGGMLPQILAAVTNDPDITPDWVARILGDAVAANTPTADQVAAAAMAAFGPTIGHAVTMAVVDAESRDNVDLARLITQYIGEALTNPNTSTEGIPV